MALGCCPVVITMDGAASVVTAVGTVATAVVAVWIALRSERKGKALVADERRAQQSREALTEAYRVQVVQAYRTTDDGPADEYGDPLGSVRQLAAMVVNHGYFTITEVRARFVFARRSGVVTPQRSVYVPGTDGLPDRLTRGWAESEAYVMEGILTPRGAAIRFESSVVPEHALENPYPLLRWRDQGGTCWQYRLGRVRPIEDDAEWRP